jgi:poly-gamma-glutamate synthesis protein (capsule biosynthesis protein)
MSATLIAVGDIGPNRLDPAECFALSRDLLRSSDVTFAQLECNLTDRGARLPQVRHTHRSPPGTARDIAEAGFDVISFAGNHCMDWGAGAFFDTIDALRGADLDVIGVGASIAEAREPLIRDVGGARIAWLAASSILPHDFWAEENRPGCVPMRAHTIYEQIEKDQPGTPARIHTYAHRGDLQALCETVRAARAQADAVVVSLHWGIHFVPFVLADYQREVAHALIDAGTDLILGHHAHILKGVEVYRGKAIFYSLGNFAIDLPMTPEHAAGKGFREIQALSPGWEPDFGSLYNFPPDSRMTIFVRAEASGDGIGPVAFRPAFINRDAQPAPLDRGDPRHAQVTAYMRQCCAEAGLAATFEEDGDWVNVSA